VGFRPAVYRLATRLGLTGFVRNDGGGVTMEVEGEPAAVESFQRELASALPPLARVTDIQMTDLPTRADATFVVADSERSAGREPLIPPDLAICADCLRELDDPSDRRHAHPFITCTNCGPRFSITASLPYDRARTTMASFPMCPPCREEFHDPGNRRFHAQTICCNACGPHLWIPDARGGEAASGREALERVRRVLGEGGIVALKGLGGFHLACRADRSDAVTRLRERKRRPTKPFAVMARDLETARALVDLDSASAELLRSPAAPIVLAPRRPGNRVAEAVAPGLTDLGIMLPTTPLHALLFRGAPYECLVMTSGNVSDEPICIANVEAVRRLSGIADLFLLHDREILRRVDDSVVRTHARGTFLVRRSRGWVPSGLPLPERTPSPVLALGGHLQVTACLATGERAFMTQHIGDLEEQSTREFLEEAARGLEDLLHVRPRIVVTDLHPDYGNVSLAERLARERAGSVVRVQHHLAHVAAVLAEHGRFPEAGQRAVGLALDGTGWGPDGTSWGCECLELGGDLRWRRLAGAEPVPLVGGEAAVREPWRIAVAVLARAGEAKLLEACPLAEVVGARELATIGRLAVHDWPLARGAGRLFEAAGALLGLVARNAYEGEAAARLESLAARHAPEANPWPETGERPGPALLEALARRAARGGDPAILAAEFHASFCHALVGMTLRAAGSGLRWIAVGGGCAVNRILRDMLREGFRRAGVEALFPVEVPPGDGGLSYGQAALAAAAAARGVDPARLGSEEG
jgi:hydrogenase maturation protein HypF